jgi:hypothetical protein
MRSGILGVVQRIENEISLDSQWDLGFWVLSKGSQMKSHSIHNEIWDYGCRPWDRNEILLNSQWDLGFWVPSKGSQMKSHLIRNKIWDSWCPPRDYKWFLTQFSMRSWILGALQGIVNEISIGLLWDLGFCVPSKRSQMKSYSICSEIQGSGCRPKDCK